MIHAIEHIAIAAHDTAALARWYCDRLGFRVVVEGRSQGTGKGMEQGTWFVGPKEGGALVEIVPATEEPRTKRERNDPGWSHLAFSVPTSSDFDAVVASLRANGVTFTSEPTGQPGERRLAFFRDLEGNELQLAYRPQPLGS